MATRWGGVVPIAPAAAVVTEVVPWLERAFETTKRMDWLDWLLAL